MAYWRFEAGDSGPLLHLEELAPENSIAPHDDEDGFLRYGVSAGLGIQLGRKVVQFFKDSDIDSEIKYI